jgi:hypothetical protein
VIICGCQTDIFITFKRIGMMRFPVIRERVRVQGRSGTFLVLSVDRARGVADVISTVRGGHVENVPLSSILPLAGSQSQNKEDPKSRESL